MNRKYQNTIRRSTLERRALEKEGVYEISAETIQELERYYEQKESTPRALGEIEIKKRKIETLES